MIISLLIHSAKDINDSNIQEGNHRTENRFN